MFLFGILERHHVNRPAGQFRGQANILTAFTNRLSEVIGIYRNIHRVGVFVNHNRADFSRRHGVDHQLRRIVIPQHNIDALVIQIIGNCLHARPTHTDTGAHRINPCILALDGDLGALTWVSSRALNLNDALGDLWNFDTEQLNQHVGRNSRHQQLRPTRIVANTHKNRTGAVVDPKYFTSDQFFSR